MVNVPPVSQLLPLQLHVICSWCGKTIANHPKLPVSHGICKECAVKVMAELKKDADVFKFQESFKSHSNRAFADLATAGELLGQVRRCDSISSAKYYVNEALTYIDKAKKILEEEVLNGG